jgi:RND family efflux transporter MFP subunit
MVERGMPIVQLVDISTLKLTVNVSEADIKFISTGAPATVIVEAVGDTVQGKVSAIGSRATAGARTFPVELRLPGSKKLRSGMFSRAVIATKTLEDALLLPRAAVLPDAGNTVVFLAKGGTAQKRIVDIIGNVGDQVAVDGIAVGDTVLTTGNQMLTHGSQIALTLAGREVTAK